MSASFVPIRGLHHFAWRCRDCEETRAFYEDLLGLPLVHVIRSDVVPSTGEHCPYVHVFFRMADGSHLAFFDLGDDVAAAPSPNTPAWVNHIALRVDSREALAAAKARLEAAGVEVLGITDHHVIESIYFFDPNGIRLELTVPTASTETTARHVREAHAAVEAWTREKRARRGTGVSPGAGAGAAAPAAGGADPAEVSDWGRWMPERRERRLATIDVKPGAALESQSGLQMMRPRIYGAFEQAPAGPGGAPRTGAIVMHPTSNFMGHYLIAPLAARGITCLGLNSRYAGNDTVLLMERVLQDLGAGVRFLREELGCARVVLVGNSGGAALAAYYQAEAERFTATTLVDGDPSGLVAADLPPVDAIAICAAHEGRSHLLLRWLDPSLLDEHDVLSVDPSLDMYDPSHWTGGPGAPPAYSATFLRRFLAGQRRRRDAIEARVRERLRLLRATAGAPRDEVFVVYRTHADPRCLDLTLDANDRAPGSVWGDASAVNASANAMGRTTSLTAFLSQWSSASRAGGPENLARTSLPVLLLTYSADQSTFPSTRDAWLAAGGSRIRNVDITGGDHYLSGRPDLQMRVADEIAAFAGAL